MDYNNLIPAPIDGKNITTDWIEEIFDGQCSTSNGKTYLGFVKDLPIRCDIIENALCWQFLVPTDWWHRDVVIPAMEELTKRLQVKDDADEGHRIHVRYRKSGNDTILWQEFYWNNND